MLNEEKLCNAKDDVYRDLIALSKKYRNKFKKALIEQLTGHLSDEADFIEENNYSVGVNN